MKCGECPKFESCCLITAAVAADRKCRFPSIIQMKLQDAGYFDGADVLFNLLVKELEEDNLFMTISRIVPHYDLKYRATIKQRRADMFPWPELSMRYGTTPEDALCRATVNAWEVLGACV